MKTKLLGTAMVLFVLSMVCLSSAAQRSITVSGVVIDSATNTPVQNAIVLLYDTKSLNIDTSNLSTLPLDTAFTTATGTFTKTISAPTANYLLIYVVIKPGYSLYYSGTALLTTTVNVGTIKIKPNALAPKDTVTVTGKVVDAGTGLGLANVFVGLSGGDLDTVGKTVTTGSDGTFSKLVIIGKIGTATIVGYSAVKNGYSPIVGQKPATGKTVDLGTISMTMSTSIRLNTHIARSDDVHATSMIVYALNGKQLYAGPVISMQRFIGKSDAAVLVDFRNNGKSLRQKRMMVVR